MSNAVIDDIATHAESLDPERLNQLTREAMRLLRGETTPPAPMFPDPVGALLKGYLALTRDDKRRFRTMLARIERKERARLGVAQ